MFIKYFSLYSVSMFSVKFFALTLTFSHPHQWANGGAAQQDLVRLQHHIAAEEARAKDASREAKVAEERASRFMKLSQQCLNVASQKETGSLLHSVTEGAGDILSAERVTLFLIETTSSSSSSDSSSSNNGGHEGGSNGGSSGNGGMSGNGDNGDNGGNGGNGGGRLNASPPVKRLWSIVGQGLKERIVLPIGHGIAGRVARSGTLMNIPDAYVNTFICMLIGLYRRSGTLMNIPSLCTNSMYL